MIDVNVSVSRWPFRRLPHDELSALTAKLRKAGVSQAWAGSFDALLHKDAGSANRRLAALCGNTDGMLVPFGAVNPALPDWEEEFRRCAEDLAMPGIRLHPNYHGYVLTDPRLAKLLSLAARRRMVVQIALSMEDERTQNPLVRVPPIDPDPIVDLARGLPDLRLVLLNRNWSNDWQQVRRLGDAGQVYFEFSMLEGLGAVAALLREAPPGRVLFGSHAPFYYFESAVLKVREAGLSREQETAVIEGNARQMLQKMR